MLCVTVRLTHRSANYAEIMRNLNIGNRKISQFLHQFDHVFWLGDLNYRIDMGNHGTEGVSGAVPCITF